MLSKKDVTILEEIINLKGHCLFSTRCLECPFRSKCLPEFLNTIPPTQSQRMNMALDVIAYHELLEDDTLLSKVESTNGKQQYRQDTRR